MREDCSPRHVPSEVRAIAEVPRTLSGKVLEVPVKRILMGEPPEQAASRDSLANPAALDRFVALAGAVERRGTEARRRALAPPSRRRDAPPAAPRSAAAPAARPPPPPRATAGGGCGPDRPRATCSSAVRRGEPLAPQVRAQRVGPGQQQPGRDARRRVAHERVVGGERGGERGRLGAPVAGRRGGGVQREGGGDQQHDRRRELSAPSSVPSTPATRAAAAAATASAQPASHHARPATPANRRARPVRGTSVRATTQQIDAAASPASPARRAPPASRAAAAAAAAARRGPTTSTSTESAPAAATASPATGAPIATSPPSAASAQPSASASASCGRTQWVSTQASCPRARRSSCAHTAARRSASLHRPRRAGGCSAAAASASIPVRLAMRPERYR